MLRDAHVFPPQRHHDNPEALLTCTAGRRSTTSTAVVLMSSSWACSPTAGRERAFGVSREGRSPPFWCLPCTLVLPALPRPSFQAPCTPRRKTLPVDGARRLNLYCEGSGSPRWCSTEAPAAEMMVWRHVQAEIAKFTRVCAYDRAGLGFSDAAHAPVRRQEHGRRPAPACVCPERYSCPSSMSAIRSPVSSLSTTSRPIRTTSLARSWSIPPSPARSKRCRRRRRPRAATPSSTRWSTGSTPCAPASISRGRAHCRSRKRRKRAHASTRARRPDGTRPRRRTTSFCALWRRPRPSRASGRRNSRRWRISLRARVNAAWTQPNSTPSTRLSATSRSPSSRRSAAAPEQIAAWRAGHDRIAALSSRGDNTTVAGAGHFIQIDQPRAVIDAVRRVVAVVRLR